MAKNISMTSKGQDTLPTEPIKQKKQKSQRQEYGNPELHGSNVKTILDARRREMETFGTGARRRTVGGQLEDPTAPQGLDWLNAHNGSMPHSWNEPQRGTGGNPALERRRADELLNPVQHVGSGDRMAIRSPHGTATNMLGSLPDGLTGADAGNPLTMGERSQVSNNVNSAFNGLASQPLPSIFGNTIQRAQQRPMSNEGKIPNANFDLFNGGPDASMMQHGQPQQQQMPQQSMPYETQPFTQQPQGGQQDSQWMQSFMDMLSKLGLASNNAPQQDWRLSNPLYQR